MPYNNRPKAPWPTQEPQSSVLKKLAPAFTAEELAEILGLESHYDARGAIDALRKLSFNIENDRETGTFRFHPVPKGE